MIDCTFERLEKVAMTESLFLAREVARLGFLPLFLDRWFASAGWASSKGAKSTTSIRGVRSLVRNGLFVMH